MWTGRGQKGFELLPQVGVRLENNWERNTQVVVENSLVPDFMNNVQKVTVPVALHDPPYKTPSRLCLRRRNSKQGSPVWLASEFGLRFPQKASTPVQTIFALGACCGGR